MYVTEVKRKGSNGKIYTTVLLRRSYRDGDKVKNETVGRLTDCSLQEIQAIRDALKSKSHSTKSTTAAPESVTEAFQCYQGKSVGSVWLIEKLANSLGITDALGDGFHARLSLWLIVARILNQGSRLSAIRLNDRYDIPSILKLQRGFDENDLYETLEWLSTNQSHIEDKLFKTMSSSSRYYFYDVTSTYLEGMHNEFGAYGYNRDQKKRKKQIVVGLLCQDEGWPVSVEAFNGNTQDTETVESQLHKIKTRFQGRKIVFVGDRGMVRVKQMQALEDLHFHYITALTMPQMKKLLNDGTIMLKAFSNQLKSVIKDGVRYIYRKNQERAKMTESDRDERLQTVQKHIVQENEHLRKPNTSVESAKNRMVQYAKRLCIHEWAEIRTKERSLYIEIIPEKLAEKSQYDGCYVWTTDLPKDEIGDKEIYDRYKDLKYIEDAFRDMKTEFLEIRPLHVRSKKSTRGHLLVTMLAYMILKALKKAWDDMNITVEEGLDQLSLICQNIMKFTSGAEVNFIPEPTVETIELLNRLNLKLPKTIERVAVPVVTRKKLKKST